MLTIITFSQQYEYQTWKRKPSTKEAFEKGLLSFHEKQNYLNGFNTNGLSKFCRHPNFTFEQLNWWLWDLLTLLSSKSNQKFYSLLSPISMSILFECSTRFTESITLGKYPNYKHYQSSTSMFIPQLTILKGLLKKTFF